ncbi:MAG: NifB/NifX family molybdenum-iron cluster-binding protein [bacterium]
MQTIAVPVQNNLVSAHFGHAPEFRLFSIEDGKIIKEKSLENPGHQPGLLPRLLRDAGADIIISGGMGQKAITIFEQNNIDVICGASGEVKNVINDFISGQLEKDENRCSHEGDHNHNHHGLGR